MCLEIILIKDEKDLHGEIVSTLLRKKMSRTKKNKIQCNIIKIPNLQRIFLEFNAMLVKMPVGIFLETDKLFLIFHGRVKVHK